MRRFLLTSALVAPLALGSAFAQETQPTDEPLVQDDAATTTDPTTATDAPADAETADPMVTEGETDPPAAPMATDGATDADPMVTEGETDPAPMATDGATDADPMVTQGETDTAPMATDGAIDADPMATDGATDAPADPVATVPADDPAAEVAGETIMREQTASELRVDWITGTDVRSPQDESIGSVSDLIIDQENKQITAAIVSVGGFLGIGAKSIAVNFDDLQIDYDAREITLAITREEADAAPEYTFRERAEAPAPAMDAAPGLDPAAPPAN